MSYLARLKRLIEQEKFTHSPETVLTEPPKAPSVSFGSTVQGRNENISTLPVGAGDTPLIAADAETVTPFDLEGFEERAAIAEFDGRLDRVAAESLAWEEDDRRRCTQCANRRYDGVCKVAAPTKDALVIAGRSYAPHPMLMRRCEGYTPKASDPDQRTGEDRWAGLTWNGTDQETHQ